MARGVDDYGDGEFLPARYGRGFNPRPEKPRNPHNPGDLVRLKSGGPVMTVDSTSGDVCSCQWFQDYSGANGSDSTYGDIKKIEAHHAALVKQETK